MKGALIPCEIRLRPLVWLRNSYCYAEGQRTMATDLNDTVV